MRPMSDRRRRREEAARPVREALKARVRRCEVCLERREPWQLAAHEIGLARGGLRQKALDQLYALLLVCRSPFPVDCHRLTQNEPEARQLARLRLSRPQDYDLTAFLRLTRPNAPLRLLPADVEAEIDYLRLLRGDR